MLPVCASVSQNVSVSVSVCECQSGSVSVYVRMSENVVCSLVEYKSRCPSWLPTVCVQCQSTSVYQGVSVHVKAYSVSECVRVCQCSEYISV